MLIDKRVVQGVQISMLFAMVAGIGIKFRKSKPKDIKPDQVTQEVPRRPEGLDPGAERHGLVKDMCLWAMASYKHGEVLRNFLMDVAGSVPEKLTEAEGKIDSCLVRALVVEDVHLLQRGDVVIAFKGTDSRCQMFDQVRHTVRGKTSFGNVGAVQSYFAKAVNLLYPGIKELLQKIPLPSARRYFVTGHSLGGALAVLFTVAAIEDGLIAKDNTYVVTYGQPKVGNTDTARNIENMLGDHYLRVKMEGDAITDLPSADLGFYIPYKSYRHIPGGVLYFQASDDETGSFRYHNEGSKPLAAPSRPWARGQSLGHHHGIEKKYCKRYYQIAGVESTGGGQKTSLSQQRSFPID